MPPASQTSQSDTSQSDTSQSETGQSHAAHPATRLPADDFVNRHIGPDAADIEKMLQEIGVESLEAMMDVAIPDAIHLTDKIDIQAVPSEREALAKLREISSMNHVATSMIGAGYYGTVIPAVIQRNILENPAWYTAYTPYQPEISQGRLEALLNFQTVVSDLTGMDMANASMLDESTAAAEAMTLAKRVSKLKSQIFLVDEDTHPQTIDVIRTRAEPLGIEIVVADPMTLLDMTLLDPSASRGSGSRSSSNDNGSADSAGMIATESGSGAGPELEPYGVLLSYPGSTGEVRDFTELTAALHERGAVVAVATDLLALTLLTPPGEWGADVVVGSSQRFGVPLGFGGPHAGFMAVRDSARRSLPGRLVGVSVDTTGRRALRLALQTREQHIRREKATSNICTAQVLLANIASSFAVYHGPKGLTQIARRVHSLASFAVDRLQDAGLQLRTGSVFDTVTVTSLDSAAEVLDAALALDINLRPVDGSTVAFSCDETTTAQTLSSVLSCFGVKVDPSEIARTVTASMANLDRIPASLRRTSAFLQHPVFNTHHSETEMMRYLRRLADKDLALDRTMIPLGSCTMKLNAASEMIPITWPEFSDIHPFVPADQSVGYLQMVRELEQMLLEITGYDAISLQPNAGSQGELAGLLAIRRYHHSRGDSHRDVCLIPASAHGTNAASAVMAGMRVVVVATDEQGNVNLADLEAKADEYSANLAAVMVTYPSTHGVFEEGIDELCRIIHDNGGQVYVDGANLNALVGAAKPGKFGADVSHLNLHKTFAIPHGGGGPGIGPVAAREHLAPFLPNHPLRDDAGPSTGAGAVSGAPFGSAGVLPITWMYVKMMGERLRDATEVAVLSANYVARRLSSHYRVLYTGRGGLVAHECIVDLRDIEKQTGITNEDVAKRLIDYGFHAPTMSFPVAGTLMIEPTESESLEELDRFCEAMISIRNEIKLVASGQWSADDNPLVNSPHTAEEVGGDEWPHSYPRSVAGWPTPFQREFKYWPPVSRIDGGYGDRNLVCSCPSIEDLAEG
ncbi:MAG: aminomethyl-transferring glycine dehydrogenase [Microthrixaceae bacterium]